MSTDPGDLVLDPTCGSGTTAYVAEQWGRRWITIDTSRIALNIAKMRLMTATFPFYTLYDSEEGQKAALMKGRGGTPVPPVAQGSNAQERRSRSDAPYRSAPHGCDVRYGFVYKKVPHITLKSIANNEPPVEETLYDQPIEDKKRLRVAGPFTVETLQNYEPISPEELSRQREDVEELANFEDTVFEHLKSAGIKTGDKAANAVFTGSTPAVVEQDHQRRLAAANAGLRIPDRPRSGEDDQRRGGQAQQRQPRTRRSRVPTRNPRTRLARRKLISTSGRSSAPSANKPSPKQSKHAVTSAMAIGCLFSDSLSRAESPS